MIIATFFHVLFRPPFFFDGPLFYIKEFPNFKKQWVEIRIFLKNSRINWLQNLPKFIVLENFFRARPPKVVIQTWIRKIQRKERIHTPKKKNVDKQSRHSQIHRVFLESGQYSLELKGQFLFPSNFFQKFPFCLQIFNVEKGGKDCISNYYLFNYCLHWKHLSSKLRMKKKN